MIDLSQTDNFFLNILINGIDENAEVYSISQLDDQAIQINSIDGSNEIMFYFIEETLNLIRYTDSIGVEHAIELKPL